MLVASVSQDECLHVVSCSLPSSDLKGKLHPAVSLQCNVTCVFSTFQLYFLNFHQRLAAVRCPEVIQGNVTECYVITSFHIICFFFFFLFTNFDRENKQLDGNLDNERCLN